MRKLINMHYKPEPSAKEREVARRFNEALSKGHSRKEAYHIALDYGEIKRGRKL